VALCLERTKGPLVFALRTYDCLVLCPIHPLTLARYREAFTPSQAKDDPSDAQLQLDLLRTHRDKLQPLTPHSAPMRALEPLVAHRRRVVGEKVRMTNRLTRTLKNSFPQVLQWFEEKDPHLFCDFLRRWPPLKAAQLARRTTRETVFRDHHVRAEHGIAQRRHALKTATPFTTDAGVIAPHALWVQALVAQLRVTLPAIADFDPAIAQRAQRHPDCPLFHALPGAGPVFAPRLLVACGEQRARSASAAALPK
jgi:transposase